MESTVDAAGGHKCAASSVSDPMHHSITMDYIKYLAGNIIATGSAVAQTAQIAPTEFRAWTSWGIAILVGVFTIIKIILDIRKNHRPKD